MALETAAGVFAARGYAGTEVQEIADLLGVGKASLYRLYPTKKDLFLATVDRGMERLGDAVDAAAAEATTDLERIRLGTLAYLAYFDAHPETVELIVLERAVFRDRSRPTYFRYRDLRMVPWQALYRRCIDAGEVRDIPPERFTRVFSDALYGTIFTNYFAGRRESFEEQADELLDVLLHGILAESPAPRGGRRRKARRGKDGKR